MSCLPSPSNRGFCPLEESPTLLTESSQRPTCESIRRALFRIGNKLDRLPMLGLKKSDTHEKKSFIPARPSHVPGRAFPVDGRPRPLYAPRNKSISSRLGLFAAFGCAVAALMRWRRNEFVLVDAFFDIPLSVAQHAID